MACDLSSDFGAPARRWLALILACLAAGAAGLHMEPSSGAALSPASQAAAAATSAPDSTSDLDVWILAGQSNTVGMNAPDGQGMPDAAQPMPGRILMYDASGAQQVVRNHIKTPACGKQSGMSGTAEPG